jgi:hypothetical protein
MRRAPALFLIALFSVSLIAPALFASDPYANLPACCRRDGKHHCAMIAAMIAGASGPALKTGTCADFPLAKLGPAAPTSGFASSAAGICGLEAAHRGLDTHAQPFDHSSYSRAGQKRGPPVTLA